MDGAITCTGMERCAEVSGGDARKIGTGSSGNVALATASASIPAVTTVHTAWRAAGDFTRTSAMTTQATTASPSDRTVMPARYGITLPNSISFLLRIPAPRDALRQALQFLLVD